MWIPRTALGLGLVALTADAPRFAPEEGSRVVKSARERTELSLGEARSWVGGEESADVPDDIEVTYERRLVLGDLYASVGEGRPLELVRSFDELGMSAEITVDAAGTSQTADIELESELEDAEVRFVWDEDAGAYAVEPVDEDDPDVSSELLEGLEEDVDLRALLPPEEVAPGGSWTIGSEALRTLLCPGGELGLRVVDAASFRGPVIFSQDAVAASLASVADVARSVEGFATVTWTDVQGGDAGRVAVLSIELEAEFLHDATERYVEALAGAGIELPVEISAFRADCAISGEGTCVWDLEAARARSLELELDLAYEVETILRAPARDGTVEVREVYEMSGRSEIALELE